MEQRRFRRIASGVEIRFQVAESDPISREYYSGLVQNYSFGGLFLATEVSLSVGDLVHLDISVEGQPPFEARALVRWTRRFGRGRGAGLEFIDFDHVGERDFERLLSQLFESPADQG